MTVDTTHLKGTLNTTTGRIRKFSKQTAKGLQPLRRNSLSLLVIILAMAIAQLTLLWRPTVGVYFNAGALAVLVGLAVWRESIRQLAISVAIIPVATMIALSIPQTTVFAQTVVFYDALLVLGLVYRFIFTLDHPLRETRMTLRGYALALPLMVVLGQLLGVIGYGMLRNHYAFGNTSLPMVAATAVVFALAEETLFRGLIQQRASQAMHPMLAAILSAMLFTFTAINTTTILAPLFALLLGSVLAFTYYKKQNLVLTFTINALAKLSYVALMASFIFR
ncbi:MAG TPA: CPBP family intramembrane glutamic endopeptidase [Verrucomicrobiae bacterium]|jgi:membrane protease YdiL (CAAX protease family)|nr:CPBP family intramembrane glutamic endopeptidase [Verrucomicrobiae bacterium]